MERSPTKKYEPELLGGGGSQKVFIFAPKIGKGEPVLTNIFQMGWNQQLE